MVRISKTRRDEGIGTRGLAGNRLDHLDTTSSDQSSIVVATSTVIGSLAMAIDTSLGHLFSHDEGGLLIHRQERRSPELAFCKISIAVRGASKAKLDHRLASTGKVLVGATWLAWSYVINR
ncbi:hypothetical protein HGRIS_005910 [Hohenbuehelia grisea]|uniref:Uncharacterized protein n=1 Tax=Hohenbuehelia grisea TaxID=104357 RepID=A0ABR3JYQ7_9AGAR